MKTLRIKTLQSIAGKDFSYGKGGEYDAPSDRAKQFVESGLAVFVDGKRKTSGGNETASMSKGETRKRPKKKKK